MHLLKVEVGMRFQMLRFNLGVVKLARLPLLMEAFLPSLNN